MHSRNHLNPLSLAVAAIALTGWLVPASIAAQSRQSGKPGSRTSSTPRAQAPSGRTATPRAAAPRPSGGQKAAAAPQRSGDANRRADSNDRDRGQQAQGRDRGDRPADGVAVPRGPRGPEQPRTPHYYRYPYYAYGYPYGYSYGYNYRYSPYDSYLYDPFFWGYPGYGLGYPMGGGYSTYQSYGQGYQSHGQSYRSFDEGGLRLKVKPRSADVLVDGYFAGKVDDFDGVFQKLTLEAGPHRIEIRQEGYQPLSFDVRIPSDDTITYEGDLDPTTR